MAEVSVLILLILVCIRGEMALTEEQLSVRNVSQENGKRMWQFSVVYFGKEMLFQYWSYVC